MKWLLDIGVWVMMLPSLWAQEITPPSQPTNTSLSQPSEVKMYERPKHSLYLEIGGRGILGAVSYDYIKRFDEKNAVVYNLSAGFLLDLIIGAGFIYGREHHFFEMGLGISLPVLLLTPQLGYRYQGENGFLFRAGALYFQQLTSDSFGDVPWLGLSFGYAF